MDSIRQHPVTPSVYIPSSAAAEKRFDSNIWYHSAGPHTNDQVFLGPNQSIRSPADDATAWMLIIAADATADCVDGYKKNTV